LSKTESQTAALRATSKSALQQAQSGCTLEPVVDIILGELSGVDLLHGNLGEVLDAVVHEQPHVLLLQLHLLLWV
jgi:hypothetical protein